ncbi:MAG: CpaF family protein [Sciscionella sp.]
MSGEQVDYRLVAELQKQVGDLQADDRRELEVLGTPARSSADEQQKAHSIIRQVVARHMQARLAAGDELPDPEYDARLRTAVFAAIYGAGELQELLDDELVENIDINGFDQVWVSYAGEPWPRRWRPVAASNEQLRRIIANLGSYAGLNARPFSQASPELDVRLPEGSRLSAIMGATETPSISIRRNRYSQMFLRPDLAEAATSPGQPVLPDLVSLGTVTPELADFLYAAVRARMNIVIGGATDAGKTSLLRALAHCIDPRERLVTVERALELGLGRHPELHHNVREMEEVLPDAEGKGGVSIAALVRRTRRMNPSRVIVGEVLGPEVVEMLSAMAQGNDGSLSTIHARDATEVFNRISTYAQQHENLSAEVSHALMAGAIDFVVFIEKNPLLGGQRCVTEVLEVGGFQSGRVATSALFSPSATDGRATRDPEVGLTPRRAAKLAALADWADHIAGWPPHDDQAASNFGNSRATGW